MRKKLIWILPVLMFTACSKEDEPDDNFSHPVEQEKCAVIEKLYPVYMRREVPLPFPAYVMRLSDGSDLYMLRTRYNRDLHQGDRIDYRVFSFCPNEIAVIDGFELGDGSEAEKGAAAQSSRSLVASDPVEGCVAEIFDMKIRYSLTFVPIDTCFIVLEDGKLIYVKKSKLSLELVPGDRIVYNVYALSPNEVLAVKKLD